jgi:methylthioribose-1-phosphate isomerase
MPVKTAAGSKKFNIGTYEKAVNAEENKIQLYATTQESTLDRSLNAKICGRRRKKPGRSTVHRGNAHSAAGMHRAESGV